MPTKDYNPVTPGLRGMTKLDYSSLSKVAPHKPLLSPLYKSGGRNNKGHITSRHIGGGHKRKYRLIDFKRNKVGVPGKVVSLEYDPNRSAFIALLQYADGEKRYIIAPQQVKVGSVLVSGENVDILPGNSLPLKSIPAGTNIYNIELKVGKGGQLARSAGVFAQLMAKDDSYAQVKLPSGEVRKILIDCMASIGEVSNPDFENVSIGKAGRSRWLGKRSSVRGVAMNPVDHPHGGGEGKSKGRHPQSPWGQLAKGFKTRNNKRTNSMKIKDRRSKS